MDSDNFMDLALSRGQEALEAQEVPVGCIFSIGSKIIAESRNTVNETRNPTRHAEINCIDQVLKYCKDNNVEPLTIFKDIRVTVTVEPCIMCAQALNIVGVAEVIYGCANDRFGGKTVFDVSKVNDKFYRLEGDVRANNAMDLLKRFYEGSNPMAPKPKIKKKK